MSDASACVRLIFLLLCAVALRSADEERDGKGSHVKVFHGDGRTVVPVHRGDLPTGTLAAILRQLGLTRADLEDWTMRYEYPIVLDGSDVEGWTVTSPDVPEMVTCGATRDEAMGRAEDALVSALSMYVDEDQAIPSPSGGAFVFVSVPALEASKLALHEAMLAARISNVELGRRLGLDEKVVRRLRDPLHRSHISQVEVALRALGRRVVVEVKYTTSAEPVGERVA